MFAVPRDICTEMYAAAVLVYSKQALPTKRLKEIHFVDSYPDIIYAIQQTFRYKFVNSFIPQFLQWTLPSLKLDMSVFAIRYSVKYPEQNGIQCRS